jgi:Domain of unknown function (DUF222)
MFERLGPSDLIATIESTQRQESMNMARQCAAAASLLNHRIEDALEDDPDVGYAMVTGFARTTAEVAAAMNISSMAATRVVSNAEALESRLPRVAAQLAEGRTDWRTVQLIITRTSLVSDNLISELDLLLANRIGKWHCWSRRRIINAIDAAVRSIDPEAAKERRVRSDEDRHISVTPLPDGTAQIRGNVPATAGAAFDKWLSDMAASVCANDSRTSVQRRADALAALREGGALACDCGQSDCPSSAADTEPAPTGQVRSVINVIASEATVTGESEQPGYLDGYGVIDADLVRQLAENAALRFVGHPTVSPAEAMRYQPSAALERAVRCRDLTCRAPGCDVPASRCDIDHTIPFNHDDPANGGLTVPWNLKCLCRFHHRLKTFLGGAGGWRDKQLPDGTIIWTSPTGRIYRTTPSGPELFPQMRPPCAAPKPRRLNISRDRARRVAKARERNRLQRPINAAQRRLNRARKEEIEARKDRNRMRRTLMLFKGKQPSTSPFCRWINDPFEPEQLPPGWKPPPPPPPDHDDDPPF